MMPISGLISMAPIMTAVLFIFNPMDAMNMARISSAMLVPVTVPPLTIRSWISS
jgi:hypothetical protein